jgi:1,2-phenylacetyl-CoA epoxidase catalytic subunit
MTDTTETRSEAQRWMGTMVASLADNKAALGRRYAEWAVSAPTLESAVGAAAMAQDELGHARSTYPVLKALGVEVGEEQSRFGGDRRFPLLDDEFADWATFIAANLVIDATLTTFVSACEASSVTQLSQRARKILQEEGSHRVHAEAWARRICAAGGPERDRLVAGVERCWADTSRWLGPEEDTSCDRAVAEGLIAIDAPRQRERIRAWLRGIFEPSGVELTLGAPRDWTSWDPERRRVG